MGFLVAICDDFTLFMQIEKKWQKLMKVIRFTQIINGRKLSLLTHFLSNLLRQGKLIWNLMKQYIEF